MSATPTSASRSLRGLPSSLVLALLCLVQLSSACVSDTSMPGVRLSTSPPGARVYIDEIDSGFITPCAIDLGQEDAHVVRFEIPGYEPAARTLVPGERRLLATWAESHRWPRTFGVPLFLNFKAFWFPVDRDRSLQSPRVHVNLRLSTQQ